ncbi:family transcriptional regulator : [Gemmata massiliana]|uniref:Family transcriptional regulator n=1 Tax=Gemmata massiliana TaxID=1210884 RepID=A0A6P2D1U5_9BACT|nr:family transcriptional regulator : [Gemmata massiliana]
MCDTSTACRSVGILPETLHKFVRSGLFALPIEINKNGLRVWSEQDQERLRQLVAQGLKPSHNPLPSTDHDELDEYVQFTHQEPPPPPKPKPQRAPRAPRPFSPRIGYGGRTVTYQGILYPSIRALAQHLGMPQRTLRNKLARHNQDADAALSATRQKPGTKARLFQFFGEQLSIEQLADRFGMSWTGANARLARHDYNAEKAFIDLIPKP